MGILNFEDKNGYLLTEVAHFKGYEYTLFWGTTSEAYYGRIDKDGKRVTETNSYDKNYGKSHCKNFLENHAKKQMTLWDRIKRLAHLGSPK